MSESSAGKDAPSSAAALPAYDIDRAYAAAQALFDGEDAVVETFIQPVEEYDNGVYAGDEPMSEFDQQFRSALGAYQPGSQTNGENAPVHGEDIANEFLEADTYEEARNALDDFRDWTMDVVQKNEGDATIFIEPLKFDSETYRQAVVFHSFRRLIQRRHNYLFEAPESGRSVELS